MVAVFSTAAAFGDTGISQVATNAVTITETNIVVVAGKTNIVIETKDVIISEKKKRWNTSAGM